VGFFNRWVKIWAIISLLSLSVWASYPLRSSYIFIYSLIIEGQSSYVARQGIAFWTGVIGYHARFIAGLAGAIAIAFLSRKAKDSEKLNKILALVMVLEASYFILLLPYFQYLLSFAYAVQSLFLAYSYVVQPLVAAPFLFILAYKIWNCDETRKSSSIWKWTGIAFVGYILALWSNITFGRWFDMIYTEGLAFLENINVSIGFFTSTLLMTLALVFAAYAAFLLFKRRQLKARLHVGVAFVLVGFHYFFYAAYCFYVGLSFDWLMLVDIWAIPLLGLGIAIIPNKSETCLEKRTMQERAAK